VLGPTFTLAVALTALVLLPVETETADVPETDALARTGAGTGPGPSARADRSPALMTARAFLSASLDRLLSAHLDFALSVVS
jgi:hypothetical protein